MFCYYSLSHWSSIQKAHACAYIFNCTLYVFLQWFQHSTRKFLIHINWFNNFILFTVSITVWGLWFLYLSVCVCMCHSTCESQKTTLWSHSFIPTLYVFCRLNCFSDLHSKYLHPLYHLSSQFWIDFCPRWKIRIVSFFLLFIFCMFTCVDVDVSAGAHRSQKRVSDPLAWDYRW